MAKASTRPGRRSPSPADGHTCAGPATPHQVPRRKLPRRAPTADRCVCLWGALRQLDQRPGLLAGEQSIEPSRRRNPMGGAYHRAELDPGIDDRVGLPTGTMLDVVGVDDPGTPATATPPGSRQTRGFPYPYSGPAVPSGWSPACGYGVHRYPPRSDAAALPRLHLQAGAAPTSDRSCPWLNNCRPGILIVRPAGSGRGSVHPLRLGH